jgi:hypothetical protein
MAVVAINQQVYSRVLLGPGKDSRDLTKNKTRYITVERRELSFAHNPINRRIF